jgi:hypothetical protein
MKRIVLFALFLLVTACAVTPLRAQALDATVCGILAAPQSFDGKTVRIKGTVIAGFDEFVIKDPSCKLPVNAIWLAYPEGSKGKAGPVASILLQLANNSPGQAAPASRSAVSLERNKDFKQFDALLSAVYKGPGRCLGCVRSTVSATLTGRLDGVANPGIDRDSKGMVTAVRGFGNLSAYGARLVLQSVADVSGQEIDYSKAGALPKGDGDEGSGGDPIAAAHQAAKAFGGNAIGAQIERAAMAYGAPGDDNGVDLSFGVENELRKGDGTKGSGNSPDGLLFLTKLDMDRLKGKPLGEAIAHTGTHIADLRDPKPAGSLFELERRAWQVTVFSAIANREKTITLPGGMIVWNSAWSEADRNSMLSSAIEGYLTGWAALAR